MSKYIVEYEDIPLEAEREDGVDYYKCLNAPYRADSEAFIKKLTPYDETEAFDDGLSQMYEAVGAVLTMPERVLTERFGETFAYNALTKSSYGEFFNRYLTYKKDMGGLKAGDVVEFGGVRYLIVGMDESSYHVLSGRSFEVDRIFKSLEKEIHRLNDRKDLDLVAKALKGET